MNKYYKRINEIDKILNSLGDYVFRSLGLKNVLSLNANIGYRYDRYLNVRQATINSVDEFKSLWYAGLKNEIIFKPLRKQTSEKYNFCLSLLEALKKDFSVFQYVELYLERSFLKNYREYSRVKPILSEILWIGDNSNVVGLPITPRFQNYNWENDKSEVRKAAYEYWTIGHILRSGLVYPYKDKQILFSSVINYLNFFVDFIKSQSSNSIYENQIAEMYHQYVLQHDFNTQIQIPLLIPQFRYGGLDKNHKYRVDFMIINPFTQKKYGIEISPYSTHKEKNQYIRDAEKMNCFVSKYDMCFLEFTDKNLADIESVFNEISKYLCPNKLDKVLYETSIRELLSIEIS